MDDAARKSLAERRAAILARLRHKAPDATVQPSPLPVTPPPQESSSARLAIETRTGQSAVPKATSRQALLDEIKESAHGHVSSKCAGSVSYCKLEPYSGKSLTHIPVSYFESVVSRPHGLYHDRGEAKTLFFDFFREDGICLFSFGGTSFNAKKELNREESGIRSYRAIVNISMPMETAEKVIGFILHEDPNIVLDVYEALFPKNCDFNRIHLSPNMSIKRYDVCRDAFNIRKWHLYPDGDPLIVPEFDPRDY